MAVGVKKAVQGSANFPLPTMSCLAGNRNTMPVTTQAKGMPTSNTQTSDAPPRKPRTGNPAGEMTDKDFAQMSYNPMRDQFEKLDKGVSEQGNDPVTPEGPAPSSRDTPPPDEQVAQAKANAGGATQRAQMATATQGPKQAPTQAPSGQAIHNENWSPDEAEPRKGMPEKLRAHSVADAELIERITARLAEMFARALKETVAHAVADAKSGR